MHFSPRQRGCGSDCASAVNLSLKIQIAFRRDAARWRKSFTRNYNDSMVISNSAFISFSTIPSIPRNQTHPCVLPSLVVKLSGVTKALFSNVQLSQLRLMEKSASRKEITAKKETRLCCWLRPRNHHHDVCRLSL